MSTKPANDLLIHSDSPQRTEALGKVLGNFLQPGDLICLSGLLGAGKTVLSRGIGAGWGAQPPLTSPTYNLVHEHCREADSGRLLHIDLYRIGELTDAASLGIDDCLEDNATVIIEWCERLRDQLPPEKMHIGLELAEDHHRQLLISAQGVRHLALLDAWRKAICLRS